MHSVVCTRSVQRLDPPPRLPPTLRHFCESSFPTLALFAQRSRNVLPAHDRLLSVAHLRAAALGAFATQGNERNLSTSVPMSMQEYIALRCYVIVGQFNDSDPVADNFNQGLYGRFYGYARYPGPTRQKAPQEEDAKIAKEAEAHAGYCFSLGGPACYEEPIENNSRLVVIFMAMGCFES